MQTYSPIYLNFTINTAVMNFPHCFEPNNRLNVDPLNTDSDDDDTIAIAVGGTTAFVAVFQEMIDNSTTISEITIMVMVSVLWHSKGNNTVVPMCTAIDVDSTMNVQKRTSLKITCLQIHCMALNLN